MSRLSAWPCAALAVPAVLVLFAVSHPLEPAEAPAASMSLKALVQEGPPEGVVRIEGHVVSGSMAWSRLPCAWRFELTDGERSIEVHHHRCVLPDAVADGQPVTVWGRWPSSGAFSASEVVGAQTCTMGRKLPPRTVRRWDPLAVAPPS